MTEWILMGSSVAFALLSWVLAFRLYRSGLNLSSSLKKKWGWIYKLSLNKWYIDEVYYFLIIRPGRVFSTRILWKFFDQNIIDRIVNSTASLARLLGATIRPIQNGLTQSYALIFTLGTFLILLFLL